MGRFHEILKGSSLIYLVHQVAAMTVLDVKEQHAAIVYKMDYPIYFPTSFWTFFLSSGLCITLVTPGIEVLHYRWKQFISSLICQNAGPSVLFSRRSEKSSRNQFFDETALDPVAHFILLIYSAGNIDFILLNSSHPAIANVWQRKNIQSIFSLSKSCFFFQAAQSRHHDHFWI